MPSAILETCTRRASRVIHALPNIVGSHKLIQTYLEQSHTKKLNIGCGHNELAGWLNIDYFPEIPHVAHFDARKTFPLPPSTFDYVFCEHMIEHVTYPDGLKMLGECHRVLKPNGRLRISTPNLQFLADLLNDKKTDLQNAYIQWSTGKYVPADFKSDTFVINNFVRDWGHRFIYDEKTLYHSLELTGFRHIETFAVGQSNDAQLANLENVARMPEGFFQLETMTMEATKA